MDTHRKARIEMIVEEPILGRLLDLLDGLAVTGYTVVPAIAGRGRGGAWREGMVGTAGHMVMVVCVTDPARVDAVLQPVYRLVSRHIGMVTVSEVQVIRKDHF